MNIDYEFWKFIIALANFIGLILVGAYTFVTHKSDKNEERIDQVANEHKAHRVEHEALKYRVTKLEERPRHDQEIVDIHKRINSVAEGQKNLEGRFSETSQAVSRMHDYLMNKGN